MHQDVLSDRKIAPFEQIIIYSHNGRHVDFGYIMPAGGLIE